MVFCYSSPSKLIHVSKAIIWKWSHWWILTEPLKAPVAPPNVHWRWVIIVSLVDLWGKKKKAAAAAAAWFPQGEGGKPSTWLFSRKRMLGGGEERCQLLLFPNGDSPRKKGGFHHYKRMSQSFTFTHSVNTHGPLTVLGTASHQGECVYGWERNAKENWVPRAELEWKACGMEGHQRGLGY